MIFYLPRDREAAIKFLTPDFETLRRWSDEERAKDAGLTKLRKRCIEKLKEKYHEQVG